MDNRAQIRGDVSEAQKWLRRIRHYRNAMKTVLNRREKYAAALSFKYLNEAALPPSLASWHEGAQNFSHRWLRHVQAQATGEALWVHLDRDAGAGQAPDTPGDEVTFNDVEEALDRTLYEMNARREVDKLIFATAAYGCGALTIGFHADTVTRKMVMDASKDSSEIQLEAQTGEGQAEHGQDHHSEAARLRLLAGDNPELTLEERENLYARTREHDALAEKEERVEVTETRVVRRNAWMKFARCGKEVVWPVGAYHDHAEMPWYAVRKVVGLDEFKKSKVFRKGIRGKAEGKGSRIRSMLDDDYDSKGLEIEDHEDPVVEYWEIWIKSPTRRDGGVRRIVSDEFPEQFIEVDKSNPYVDDDTLEDGRVGPEHGKPLIPGFFPVRVAVPLAPVTDGPESTMGIPGVEPGWQQQEDMNDIAAMLRNSAFTGKRCYGIMDGAETEVTEALKDFLEGTDDVHAFELPSTVSGDARRAENFVVTYDLGKPRVELENFAARTYRAWQQLQGFPAASLAVAGVSPTAHQDEMGMAQGDTELRSYLAPIQEAVAESVRGILGIIRGCYGIEKLTRLLGSKAAGRVFAWTKTAFDGDRLEVAFGALRRAKEAVQREQQIKGVELLRTYLDPVTNDTVFDERGPMRELLSNLGLGNLEEKSERERELVAELQETRLMLAQVIKERDEAENRLTGESANNTPTNGTPGPKSATGGGVSAPQFGTLSAGARGGSVPSGSGSR